MGLGHLGHPKFQVKAPSSRAPGAVVQDFRLPPLVTVCRALTMCHAYLLSPPPFLVGKLRQEHTSQITMLISDGALLLQARNTRATSGRPVAGTLPDPQGGFLQPPPSHPVSQLKPAEADTHEHAQTCASS